MFPFGFVLFVSLVLLASPAAAVFGFIGGGVLAFAWIVTFAIFLGLLLIEDGHRALRRAGAGLIAAALLGLALAVGIHPAAAAEALIAAPPGDTGFWGTVNGWIATALGGIVTTAVTMLCATVRSRTKINVRTDQEQRLVELMKTGAFQGMHELELAIDDHWTPAQRQKLIERIVGWAESRGTAELKKLGLPSFVVIAMARKVVGQLQAAGIVGDTITSDYVLGDATVRSTGNPGETPALDRAAGGTGGA